MQGRIKSIMDVLVKEKSARKEQYLRSPVHPAAKKSFEDAVAECKGVSVKDFFDEVRWQVNEHYDNHA